MANTQCMHRPRRPQPSSQLDVRSRASVARRAAPPARRVVRAWRRRAAAGRRAERRRQDEPPAGRVWPAAGGGGRDHWRVPTRAASVATISPERSRISLTINALKRDLTALENLQYSVALKRRRSPTPDARAMLARSWRRRLRTPAVPRALGRTDDGASRSCRILLSDARLWVLDEPITNLDTASIALFEECMARAPAHGRPDPDRCTPGCSLPERACERWSCTEQPPDSLAARSAADRARSAPRGAPLGPGRGSAGVLRDRDDAVSAGHQSGAVASCETSRPACCGSRRCSPRCSPRTRCSDPTRGRNSGAVGAVGPAVDVVVAGEDGDALAV